jgi:FkbM family methyltransferase
MACWPSFAVVACIIFEVVDVGAAIKIRNATAGVAVVASDKSLQNASTIQAPNLHAGNLVFDFGFYNGADSRSYLAAGLSVVAIEADPTLVTAARNDQQLLAWMHSGQLKLINTAIAPSGSQPWTKFYMNKCTQEWNSFYSSIGCRGCAAPHVETPSACTEVQVQSSTCASIMQLYGVPQYFKLDIEGAESGCYSALSTLPEMVRPFFISGEVGDTSIVETFHKLGYKSFKLVQQTSGVTGAWGKDAQDCRTGSLWRSYLGVRAELHSMLSKAAKPGDVCPGSLVGGVWYDMHASREKPQAW